MATQLYKAPTFVTVRSQVGAAVADDAVLSDANYPLADALTPYGDGSGCGIVYYWSATGVAPGDVITVELLFRDSKIGTGAWIRGPQTANLVYGVAAYLPLHGCDLVYMRIVGETVAAATALYIRAATEFQAY